MRLSWSLCQGLGRITARGVSDGWSPTDCHSCDYIWLLCGDGVVTVQACRLWHAVRTSHFTTQQLCSDFIHLYKDKRQLKCEQNLKHFRAVGLIL
ncbi:hypothetical protein J6590_102420 [Homalodisca vitripennis]|nr:hypothetical protein J6590_102420 [Homalodisca vitripennis]